MADELDQETCAAGVDDGLTSEMVTDARQRGGEEALLQFV
jgi:hypothetical protein